MVVYSVCAPAWPEKVKDLVGGQANVKVREKCRFCNLAEKPLIESNAGWKILEAKYPYIPQHCILVPKKHFLALHKMPKQQFDEMFAVVGEVLSHFPHAAALGNFGKISGQTISHTHVHLLGTNVRELDIVTLLSAENLIADLLSMPILTESGYLIFDNNGNTAIEQIVHKKDLYEYMQQIIHKLFDGFFSLVQCRMYKKVSEYGYGYHNIERLAWLYGAPPEKLDDIDFLINNRITAGFGINWLISAYMCDHFKVHIMPRATVPSTNMWYIRKIAGLELFYQTTLIRTGILPETEKRWKETQLDFYKKVKDSIKGGT